jgi:small subunit ribosomal protein S3Ae
LVKKKAKVKEAYTIISPKVFGEKEIGITFASEPKQLIGREVILSALELTENVNKYYLKFLFKINRVEGNKAFTEFHGTECLQDYISRMVVRRVRRIDTVQDILTKDRVKLRVKSICVLSRKAKSSVQKSVSSKIKEVIKQEVESKNLDDFIKSLISDEIKTKVLVEARKIYPIKNFEIRKVEVLSVREMVQQS